MEVKNLLHKTVMLVSNFSKLDERFVIRKQQNCECKAVAVPLGMTRRKKVFNCNHRLMSNLYLDNEIITVCVKNILTEELLFIIKYKTRSYQCLYGTQLGAKGVGSRCGLCGRLNRGNWFKHIH